MAAQIFSASDFCRFPHIRAAIPAPSNNEPYGKRTRRDTPASSNRHKSVLPRKLLMKVILSTYSKSPPTGIPLASRVTFKSNGERRRWM